MLTQVQPGSRRITRVRGRTICHYEHCGTPRDDYHVRCVEAIDLGEHGGIQAEPADSGTTEVNSMHSAHLADGERESDTEAVAAERTGRTNAARDVASGTEQEPPLGRWDSIGEPGEELDELQGLYAADATGQEHLPERGEAPSPATDRSATPAVTTITAELWDRLLALEGQTIETPKGEPFRVIAIDHGEKVTVSPLDGAREWEVPARELEAGWLAVSQGVELDALSSIRLQEAGLESAHPEYVAGLLQAITGGRG
jgi:hypothetical protein